MIRCYEAAGDIALELLNSISKSTVSLTISGVLEIALVRSVLLQMKYGTVSHQQSTFFFLLPFLILVLKSTLQISVII